MNYLKCFVVLCMVSLALLKPSKRSKTRKFLGGAVGDILTDALIKGALVKDAMLSPLKNEVASQPKPQPQMQQKLRPNLQPQLPSQVRPQPQPTLHPNRQSKIGKSIVQSNRITLGGSASSKQPRAALMPARGNTYNQQSNQAAMGIGMKLATDKKIKNSKDKMHVKHSKKIKGRSADSWKEEDAEEDIKSDKELDENENDADEGEIKEGGGNEEEEEEIEIEKGNYEVDGEDVDERGESEEEAEREEIEGGGNSDEKEEIEENNEKEENQEGGNSDEGEGIEENEEEEENEEKFEGKRGRKRKMRKRKTVKLKNSNRKRPIQDGEADNSDEGEETESTKQKQENVHVKRGKSRKMLKEKTVRVKNYKRKQPKARNIKIKKLNLKKLKEKKLKYQKERKQRNAHNRINEKTTKDEGSTIKNKESKRRSKEKRREDNEEEEKVRDKKGRHKKKWRELNGSKRAREEQQENLISQEREGTQNVGEKVASRKNARVQKPQSRKVNKYGAVGKRQIRKMIRRSVKENPLTHFLIEGYPSFTVVGQGMKGHTKQGTRRGPFGGLARVGAGMAFRGITRGRLGSRGGLLRPAMSVGKLFGKGGSIMGGGKGGGGGVAKGIGQIMESSAPLIKAGSSIMTELLKAGKGRGGEGGGPAAGGPPARGPPTQGAPAPPGGGKAGSKEAIFKALGKLIESSAPVVKAKATVLGDAQKEYSKAKKPN